MNLLTLNDDCLSLIIGRLDETSHFILRFVCKELSRPSLFNQGIVLKGAIRLGELSLLEFLQGLKFKFDTKCLQYFTSDNLETLKWLLDLCGNDFEGITFWGITFESARVCDECLMGLCGYDKLLPKTKITLFEKYDWRAEDICKVVPVDDDSALVTIAELCAIKTLRIASSWPFVFDDFWLMLRTCDATMERSGPFLDCCFEIMKESNLMKR